MKIPARIRLTIFFTTVFSALLIVSSTLIYFRVSKSLNKDFRNEMIKDSRIMAELFKEELRLNALKEFEEEIEEFDFDLLILDKDKKQVVQSERWKKRGFVIDDLTLSSVWEAPSFYEIKVGTHAYAFFNRAIHIPTRGDYSLHLARSKETLQKIPDRLLEWMLIIQPLMVVLAAFVGYGFAKRTLRAEELAYDRLRNFTADASHELKIPLTSLRGHLEVALRKDRTTEDYKETIEEALSEAEHLSKLTQDLLLLAQSDAQQLQIDIQDVNLKEFIEDVFAQAASFPDEKNIQKKLLPVPAATVRFDPDRIRQLLLNLIDNAVRYGQPNGEIIVGATVSGGKTTLTVRDNGIGISEADQAKIFNRFYRVDKARSREQGGTGLGLSIVKWIVIAHNGTIDLESQEGKGSLFTITL